MAVLQNRHAPRGDLKRRTVDLQKRSVGFAETERERKLSWDPEFLGPPVVPFTVCFLGGGFPY